MTAHAFHTPGLDRVLASMDDDRRMRFEEMLSGWRQDVANICAGRPVEKTTLEKVREQVKRRVSDLEPWTPLEDALLIEKSPFWTAKQIAREMKRTPAQVYGRVRALGLRFRG